MHPILAYRERLALYIAAWLMIAGLLAALEAMSGSLAWGEAIALMLPLALLYAFMCLAALYLCRAFPLQRTTTVRLGGVYAIASFLSSSLWLLIGQGWVIFLTQLDLFPGLDERYQNQIAFFLAAGILLFLLAVVVHYLMLAFESARATERHTLELSALAREAELRALKAQLNPHFLFNSLNSISALTTADPEAARQMCLRLAEFLRKVLKLFGVHQIPLRDELSLLEDFIAIEKTRFGSRLSFRIEVDPEVEEYLVPSLVLQPLIENAVNHGIAQLLEGGRIDLSARRRGSRVEIIIENPRDPDERHRKGNGIGLKNVLQRIEALYGTEGLLEVQRLPERFKVRMLLPADQSTIHGVRLLAAEPSSIFTAD